MDFNGMDRQRRQIGIQLHYLVIIDDVDVDK